MEKPFLKQAREKAGMTQKQFGMLMGYSEKSSDAIVRMWESGRKPVPRKHIVKISETLHIDPLDLL